VVGLPFVEYLFPRLADALARGEQVLRVYPLAALDAQLYPFPGDRPNDGYHVVASALALAGCVALLWRLRRTMLTATVLMYTALLVASPAITDRYLWPLFPVIAAGLVVGVAAVSRALAQRVSWLPSGPVVSAAILALVALGALRREMRVPPPTAVEREPETRAVFEWLAQANARAPTRAVYANPRVLTLESRVPAMAPLFTIPSKHLAALRDRNITHLVWPMEIPRECRARLAHELVALYPERFALEYENAKYRVYRLVNMDAPLVPIEGYDPAWGQGRCNPGRSDDRQ
jgi:hypothetical protein